MNSTTIDLQSLKAEYDDLYKREREQRQHMDIMRCELTILTKKRREAKRAWLDAIEGIQPH